MEIEEKKTSFWSFDNLSLFVLSICLFALPWFNLPLWGTAMDFGKKFLLISCALLAFILWLLGRLQESRLVLPKNYILFGILGVTASTLLSTIFSGSFWNSFGGLGFELDAFISILTGAALLFLFSALFQTRKRFLGVYLGIFVVSLVVFLLQFLVIFLLRVNVLASLKPLASLFANNLFSSLVGKWYDFGVYFGFIGLSSLIMLELFSLKEMPLFRYFISICFVASLAALAFVNYLPIWIAVGVFSLIIYVYKMSFWASKNQDPERVKKATDFFRPSFFVVLVALLFITLGSADKFGNTLSVWRANLGVSVFDVKPSWVSTYDIAKKTLHDDPLLGAGPNNFSTEWMQNKPVVVNETPYWDINFRFGVGLIPTMFVTNGVLGLAVWLVFLAAILWYGFKFIFSINQDRSTRALLILSFCGSVYLWLFAIIYVPDNFLLALAFIVTGLFSAILTDTRIVKNAELLLTKDPRLNFASVLLFVALTIGSVVGGYLLIQKYISVYIYQKGLYTLQTLGNLDEARSLVGRAIKLSEQDLYYRTMSELDILQINRLLSQSEVSQEEAQARFATLLDSAINNARQATEVGENDYLNWLSLGKVYEAVVPLGVENAYENAAASYLRAQKLNPNSPSILLENFARLEISNKNLAKAKEYIKQSLAVKPDYSPAVSLAAQIYAEEGNTEVAIRKMEEFAAIYPQSVDAGFYFQIGFLKYRRGDYRGAAQSLSKSVALESTYANAKYFLGLSYDALGERSLALKNFEEILQTNPDNQEVQQIIQNLKSGRKALGGAIEPIKKTEKK